MYIHNLLTVLYPHFMFIFRNINDMLHLYDFKGVTRPQQFLTFVIGPLLDIIE